MKASKLLLIGTAVGLAILAASTVHAAPPGQPTSVSPAGKVSGSSITFLWDPVSGATKYQLQVKDGSIVKFNRTFTAAQAGCSGGGGTCSAEAAIGNGAAALTWTLRAGNADGFGAWSEAKNLIMTNEMRSPISKLPFTISSPGSFYVTGNLTSTGSGITVNAHNVTIDLNGYTLTGPAGGGNDGVYMNARKNVEIRNGTILNFGRNGIFECNESGSGHRVIGVRVSGNGSRGISLFGEQHLIENCGSFDHSDRGIHAGAHSIIRGCTCTGNNDGIVNANGCIVSGNNSSQNTRTGIESSIGSSLIGNTASDNGEYGIFVYAYSTIKNNTTTRNGKSGIYIVGGHDLVDGNTAYLNDQIGSDYPNISDCATCQWGLNVK